MAARTRFFSYLVFSWLVFMAHAARPDKPMIWRNDPYIQDGEDVVLTCKCRTANVDRYSWRHNGVDLPGEHGENYTMLNATIARDDGNYTCFAYIDTVASLESSVFPLYLLPINTKLTFLDGSRHYIEKGSNQSVTVTCSTSSVGRFTYCLEEHCSASNTFTITASQVEAKGRHFRDFYCQPLNHGWGGSFSDPLRVTLIETIKRPTVTSDNKWPKEGDTIRLFCQTDDSKNIQFTWKFNGLILTIGSGNIYVIPKAVGYHEGNYTCIASIGRRSSEESETFTLSVQPRPVLLPSGRRRVENSGPLRVESGSRSVSLICRTLFRRSFTYVFFKDSTEVQSSDSTTYTIDTPLTTDSGTYTCAIIYNDTVSRSTQSLNLTVEDIDECTEGTDNCDQVCTNTDGSFYCTCHNGFILATDNTCQSVVCDNQVADIVFAIDNSAASGFSNYRTLLLTAGNFTQRFKLGPTNARFATVIYADTAAIWFNLASFNNHRSLIRFMKYAYNQPSQQPPQYKISVALEYVKDNQMFSVVRGGRNTAKDVLILFVDDMTPVVPAVVNSVSSHSPSARATDLARSLKNQGVEIITVCVGCKTLDHNFLQDLVSYPSHVVTAASYSELDTAMDRVANILCAN